MYYTILKSFIIYDHFKNLTYSNHLWSPCQISKYLKRYASDYFWLSIFGPCLRERDKASNKRNWRIKSSMLIITRKLAPSNIPLTINPTNLSAVSRLDLLLLIILYWISIIFKGLHFPSLIQHWSVAKTQKIKVLSYHITALIPQIQNTHCQEIYCVPIYHLTCLVYTYDIQIGCDVLWICSLTFKRFNTY